MRIGRGASAYTKGAQGDFRALGIQPSAGMQVLLDDMEEFCTKGIIEHDESEGWVARIDWKTE
jgi:hypothetical protein